MTAGTKARRNDFLFAFLAFVNSAWLFAVYLSITHIGTFQPATLAKALEGTAERPYVYRVLVAWIAKLFAPLIPPPITAWLRSIPDPIQSTYDVLSSGGYGREASIVLAIMFLSLLGFAFAEREFLRILGSSDKEQLLLPLFAQLLILPFSLFFAYYYDLPQVLLVTLSLIFMKQAKWRNYLIVLAIASFNKETSLLLIGVFVVYYLTRLPRKIFIGLLAAQAVTYGLVRLLLLYLFRHNVGAAAFLTLINHKMQYSAYPSTLVFTLFYFLLIGFLVWKNWRQKHPFLQATVVIPLLILVLFFTSGMPMEFRVFLDALPALAILIFPSLPSESSVAESKIPGL